MESLLLCLLFFNVTFASSVSTISIPLNGSQRVLRGDLYGYSIEPSSAAPYLRSNLASKVLGYVAEIAGVPAPIRIGGNIADQTVFDETLETPSQALPNETTVSVLRIKRDWFGGWKEYFPRGTNILYTLNLRNETDSWATAMHEANAAMGVLGKSLSHFELGNEIDHYINKGWREADWDTKQYTKQWRRLTSQILSSAFYKNATDKPRFQAAVFADPPMIPDQQDEIDDFDIINVTRAGLVDPKIIDSYAVHLYPQSTCDEVRRARLSLNLLSNHNVIWRNLSQYIPQEAAARAAGSRLVLGETNSASCSGRSGISDTFGAALWATDYVLTAATIGIEQVYFHLGHQSEYSAFTPLPYAYKGENLTAGVRANFFSHLFLAHVVASETSEPLQIAALPAANASDFSGYAIFGNKGQSNLEKLVFIDLGVWNSTSGVHNPSTLSSADSSSTSPGVRPSRTLQIQTTWRPGTRVDILRLQGPGTNAKSGVTVSGIGIDSVTGNLIGQKLTEQKVVTNGGFLTFELRQAEGILLEKISK